MQGIVQGSPPALEDAQAKTASGSRQGTELQAQGRRGGKVGMTGRTHQDDQGILTLQGHLQSAQGCGRRRSGEPDHEQGKTAAAQQLFPQGQRALGPLQDHQPLKPQPGLSQRRTIGQPGRRHQGHRQILGAQIPQQGHEQGEFPKATTFEQKLGECPPRPSPPGQTGIEFGKAARQSGAGGGGQI